MSTDYQRIAQAIRYLEENFRTQPTLEDIAAHLHLSPYHFQRLFRRWAGITPKRFLQFLTIEHAKTLLSESHTLLDTTNEVGLSSPSRLHDLFVTIDGMTPGQFKRKGAGIQVTYGFHTTPFGECLLATTKRGICALFFLDGTKDQLGQASLLDPEGSRSNKQGCLFYDATITATAKEDALAALRKKWPAAELHEQPETTEGLINQIFPADPLLPDSPPILAGKKRTASLFLKGTNFQLKVWEALLNIPPGFVCSYADIARQIGRPNATRAVANAIGANSVAYLIPCHRVLRKSGLVSGYRWNPIRKKAILAWEAAQRE